MLYFATETKNKQVMKTIFVETIYHDGKIAGIGQSHSSRKKAMAFIAELAEERNGKISEDGLSTTYTCHFTNCTAQVTIKMEESDLQ